MSSTTTKNLLLSQPKSGQFEGLPATYLTHSVETKNDHTEIRVEIPGIDPSTVDVEFDNNTLHIECARGVLTLPVDPTVDISKIKADIVWGMLTLTIPLPKPPEARSIKVSIHDATTPATPPAKAQSVKAAAQKAPAEKS
jgi:HSP20 family molecular chaperone IbpA